MPTSPEGATLNEAQKARMAEYFKPINWSQSFLGRDVWVAYNQIDSAISAMLSATPRTMAEAAEGLINAKNALAIALRNRDHSMPAIKGN